MTQMEIQKFRNVLYQIGEGVWGGGREAKELLSQLKSEIKLSVQSKH
jgi:hypothetical protein